MTTKHKTIIVLFILATLAIRFFATMEQTDTIQAISNINQISTNQQSLLNSIK